MIRFLCVTFNGIHAKIQWNGLPHHTAFRTDNNFFVSSWKMAYEYPTDCSVFSSRMNRNLFCDIKIKRWHEQQNRQTNIALTRLSEFLIIIEFLFPHNRTDSTFDCSRSACIVLVTWSIPPKMFGLFEYNQIRYIRNCRRGERDTFCFNFIVFVCKVFLLIEVGVCMPNVATASSCIG